ncbi:sulfotransferase family cytosolic 1B member 1-like [Octopus sinensis]|uniref:Sulfotransferase family cytosolic 1B member 1-like n=1 Tax=Octopus sinensis TaxID=2607531 RepID=A0A6P7SP59_9MOLL|nr:sulfotransferase family cytosolic 1B member 1-like [Octopus sinensis]XP_029640191.1 sulfotransferase family cytosolic 1B member 1-like [Octopus sinensis]XP_036361217.1 sulfotransferase family cytosolic 1B member 1-like [Octopus sinensis]XP_036361218.1 sulfotransferase family cytosolic 1B member 1-like [Octopus sinensis]XP_036361219.1 sulfotransferase family cytosolic 1B member 1-like [Octopus sinensis]
MPEVYHKDPAGCQILSYDYNGFLVPSFPNVQENMDRLPDMPVRDDDVFLLGYFKAGCHWMWEISGMLLNGSAEYSSLSKDIAMMEYASQDQIDQLPSPRVLNNHLLLHHLPREIFTKKSKMIFMTRNPRDIAVSAYHHTFQLNSFYHYDGDWKGFFEMFLEGKLNYGNWFQYMLQWEKDIKDHPDLPILIVKYEDLKKDPVGNVAKVSKFLGLPKNDQLFKDIADKCSFSKMRVAKQEGDILRTSGESLYRKGVVGDWKNWFTVSQNERFQVECDKFDKQSTLFNTKY